MTKQSPKNDEQARLAAGLRSKLICKIAAHMQAEGVQETAVAGLNLYRRDKPTVCNSAAYEPRLIVLSLIHI